MADSQSHYRTGDGSGIAADLQKSLGNHASRRHILSYGIDDSADQKRRKQTKRHSAHGVNSVSSERYDYILSFKKSFLCISHCLLSPFRPPELYFKLFIPPENPLKAQPE